MSSTTSFNTWFFKVSFKRLWPVVNLLTLNSYISWSCSIPSHEERGLGVLWWGQGGCSKLDLLWVLTETRVLCFHIPVKREMLVKLCTPTLSPHRPGSADFFALFLRDKEHHGVLGFIMGEKRHFWPLAIVIYISATCERRHCCLSVWASCGLALCGPTTLSHAIAPSAFWMSFGVGKG